MKYRSTVSRTLAFVVVSAPLGCGATRGGANAGAAGASTAGTGGTAAAGTAGGGAAGMLFLGVAGDAASTIRACSPEGGQGGASGGQGGEGGASHGATLPTTFHWSSSDRLVAPIADDAHPILSVKDPSVVYFEGRYHLFATTADKSGQWSMVYLTFTDFAEAGTAPQYYLGDNPALTGYHAAPQVFYFAPQQKWYLIFQSGQPQYSTTDDITKPESWTRPVNFFASEPQTVLDHRGSGNWLDFWTICDDRYCHLFFADDNGEIYRSQTKLADFPNGFGEPVIAIQGTKETLFEGGAVYRVADTEQYLAMIEAFGPSGQRYYRSFVANSLDGEWSPLAAEWENPFAGSNNVTFESGNAWTRDVSHGELLRTGYDQTLTVSLSCLRFLYQGLVSNAPAADYYTYPYRLALLTRTE